MKTFRVAWCNTCQANTWRDPDGDCWGATLVEKFPSPIWRLALADTHEMLRSDEIIMWSGSHTNDGASQRVDSYFGREHLSEEQFHTFLLDRYGRTAGWFVARRMIHVISEAPHLTLHNN